MSSRTYPAEFEERVTFDGHEICVRPIRPEDESQHARFLARVNAEDIQLRFFHAARVLDHPQLARLTDIDYDCEMAFIAVDTVADQEPETLGVVRLIADPDGKHAEFAILVRSDLKGKGLGVVLLDKIVRYGRERRVEAITGDVMLANHRMLALARHRGFEIGAGAEPGLARVTLSLRARA